MIINVNKVCEINQENIAPCREDRLIAINVIPKDRDESKGFINYCLAIDDSQQCCEDFGVELLMLKETKDNIYYVKHIEHNADYDLGWLIKTLREFGYDRTHINPIEDGSIISKVIGENNELIAIGLVYNSHNGYYSHEVYANLNGKTDVSYL